MKVLVTGASGFLGGWLVQRLVAEGHHVRVLVRKTSQLAELQKLHLEYAYGDVTDYASVDSAVKGVDTVFHLAGLIAYTRTQRANMDRINVGGTENVVRACSVNSIHRLIYLSSVVAIGASFDGKVPLNENSKFNVAQLRLGYFDSKRAAEGLVMRACREGRLDAVILNPTTIYGAADAKKGSRGAQLKAARGELKFYPPGGVGVVAASDVVDAIIAAWKKGRCGERYILNAENLQLHEVFKLIAREAGVAPPAWLMPKPALLALGKIGDAMEYFGRPGLINSERAWTAVLYHWFDSSKAQRELGMKFKPAKVAIAESISWSRDNGLLS